MLARATASCQHKGWMTSRGHAVGLDTRTNAPHRACPSCKPGAFAPHPLPAAQVLRRLPDDRHGVSRHTHRHAPRCVGRCTWTFGILPGPPWGRRQHRKGREQDVEQKRSALVSRGASRNSPHAAPWPWRTCCRRDGPHRQRSVVPRAGDGPGRFGGAPHTYNRDKSDVLDAPPTFAAPA